MATKSQALKKKTHEPISIGIRELNQQLSKVLAMVKAGATINITEHGVEIARLLPYTTDQESIFEQYLEAGLIHPAVNPAGVLSVKPLPYKGKISLSEEILREREEFDERVLH